VADREVLPWDTHLEEVTTLLIQFNLRVVATKELDDVDTLSQGVEIGNQVFDSNGGVALSCFERDVRA
jgi:hypothetical protein